MKIFLGVRQSSNNAFELTIRMPQTSAKSVKKIFEIEGEITSGDDLRKLKEKIKKETRRHGINHIEGLDETKKP